MPVSLRESLAIGFSPRLLWIFSRNEASTNKMGEKSITRKRCANSCWICWLFCQLSALATSKRELSALVDPKTSKGPTSSLGGCLSQRMFQSHPHGWASRFALTLYITIYKLYIYYIINVYYMVFYICCFGRWISLKPSKKWPKLSKQGKSLEVWLEEAPAVPSARGGSLSWSRPSI